MKFGSQNHYLLHVLLFPFHGDSEGQWNKTGPPFLRIPGITYTAVLVDVMIPQGHLSRYTNGSYVRSHTKAFVLSFDQSITMNSGTG
jgi:hypothetical protein